MPKKKPQEPPYRETESDRGFLQCLIGLIRDHGVSPTEGELAEAMGGQARNTVRWRLRRLEEFGYITRRKGYPRTIRVVRRPSL